MSRVVDDPSLKATYFGGDQRNAMISPAFWYAVNTDYKYNAGSESDGLSDDSAAIPVYDSTNEVHSDH